MCLNITKRFFHRSARMFQQSIQHCSAEELNLHERALHTVRPVSNAGESETATKEIIADVLRGFLLLENAALTGSEQVFVFGVAGKSNAYRHIANALRERERENVSSRHNQSGSLSVVHHVRLFFGNQPTCTNSPFHDEVVFSHAVPYSCDLSER